MCKVAFDAITELAERKHARNIDKVLVRKHVLFGARGPSVHSECSLLGDSDYVQLKEKRIK